MNEKDTWEVRHGFRHGQGAMGVGGLLLRVIFVIAGPQDIRRYSSIFFNILSLWYLWVLSTFDDGRQILGHASRKPGRRQKGAWLVICGFQCSLFDRWISGTGIDSRFLATRVY
ncbi:hypothetical protein B0T24DRAFT_611613 [Lasiosphaeria ovina]|uniref:Uncharacterized protein n=1 Tax=Lasiosphaeria ovina TaxID=92902 RepID=A0AAE0NDD2_9PEZI|nr:hypothetical protein B0T24DRAFT_611613 [Lasiosphaeria ovina]